MFLDISIQIVDISSIYRLGVLYQLSCGTIFMDDEKFLPFIIRSKLNRPQIHGVYLHRQQLINELDQNRNRPLTLISAPAGYGKSTLASYWLETIDSPNAWGQAPPEKTGAGNADRYP